MLTNPNTNPRNQTLKTTNRPLAFVRDLKVVAAVEPEDTRTVEVDSDGNLTVDSEDNIVRVS